MQKIALINCKPNIVSQYANEITLRFHTREERLAFEEAVRQACLSPEEHAVAYAKEHNIDQGTPVATD